MRQFKMVLITFMFIQSCSGQSDLKNKIIGNWQIVKHKKLGTIYQEIYIDSVNIYYYDINLGLNPKSTYSLKGNSLSHSQLGSEFEELGEVSILSDSIFTIEFQDEKVDYKKIEGKGVLEELVNSSISQGEFSKAFFRRYESWNTINE